MSPIRIRPRSAIADPDLARVAIVDLPGDGGSHRGLRAPASVVKAMASFRRPMESEQVIVLTLAPVPARRR